MQREIDHLCEDLFDGGRNHYLLYGEPQTTSRVLRGIYDEVMRRNEFICHWHDASKIKGPMDFFEPILQSKYGSHYEELKKNKRFKEMSKQDRLGGVFRFAELCGQEKGSEIINARKMPVFFIEGIEELFFKLDYGHLEAEGRRKLLNEDFMKRPLAKGFGSCLRGSLHHTKKGIFYGTVRSTQGIEYQATLGNYHYLFYAENFIPHDVWENSK